MPKENQLTLTPLIAEYKLLNGKKSYEVCNIVVYYINHIGQ